MEMTYVERGGGGSATGLGLGGVVYRRRTAVLPNTCTCTDINTKVVSAGEHLFVSFARDEGCVGVWGLTRGARLGDCGMWDCGVLIATAGGWRLDDGRLDVLIWWKDGWDVLVSVRVRRDAGLTPSFDSSSIVPPHLVPSLLVQW